MQSVFPIDYDEAKFSPIQYVAGDGQVMYLQIVDPEFSSVCPKTGMPDYSTVVLQYIPLNRRVELKAWKLYLRHFYGVGAFHETCTQKIMEDFIQVVRPRWLRLTIVWGARGGLHTTTQMVWSDITCRVDDEPYVDDKGNVADPRDFQNPSDVAYEWTNR